MSEQTGEYQGVRPLRIERDPDRERASSSAATVTAVGAQYPSGDIIIQWRREAFEPGERSEETVTSHYHNVEDATQATAGTVVFEDE
jgi:hypothetical protein